MKVFPLVAMLALLLTACQALNRRDPLLTLEAESISYAAEATAISQTMEFDRTNISATAQAQVTQIAALNGINQQLVSTLSIQVTPTLMLESAVLPSSVNTNDGRRLFTRTGVSASINPDNGCVVNATTVFTGNEDRIYATAHVVNLNAGAVLRSQWFYGDESRYDFEWAVEQDYTELCIWFYIDPSITPFTPGSWSVQLYADGFNLEGPMEFEITGAQ